MDWLRTGDVEMEGEGVRSGYVEERMVATKINNIK